MGFHDICYSKTIEITFSSTIPDLFSEKNIDHMADDISDFQIGNSRVDQCLLDQNFLRMCMNFK